MTRVFACLMTIVMAAACGVPAGSGVRPASDGPAAASPSGTPQPASTSASGTPATGAPAAATAARAAFLSHAFTDVRDGQQFTLGGFAGKQVLVLGMAVW